jgi:hypothetical protein
LLFRGKIKKIKLKFNKVNLLIIVGFFQDSQEYFDVLLTDIKLLFSSLLFISDSFEPLLNLDEVDIINF